MCAADLYVAPRAGVVEIASKSPILPGDRFEAFICTYSVAEMNYASLAVFHQAVSAVAHRISHFIQLASAHKRVARRMPLQISKAMPLSRLRVAPWKTALERLRLKSRTKSVNAAK
jgi:hypothetical protein